jgi:Holliday junction resolvase RusA-like endonuclease
MKPIRITIQIEPVPKGRPRVSFHNGMARTYTPQKTKDAQDFIKARLLRHKNEAFPPHIPIRLSCTFYRSKSRYLPKREDMPFRKPDTDNLLKLLLDSIDGVLVPDDAQITTISVRKRWSPTNEGYITLKLEPDSLKGEGDANNNL